MFGHGMDAGGVVLLECRECSDLGRAWLAWSGRVKVRRARRRAKVFSARARARRLGVENTLTYAMWRAIVEAHGGRCHYCGIAGGEDVLGPDHVIPFSKGGANTADNVVPACFPCNALKGAK